MMELVRIVNSTYNEVNRNLRILEGAGLITQQRIRHKRIIRLKFENKKTLDMLKALKILEAPNDLK
jgi:predicted transcriptional regulator